MARKSEGKTETLNLRVSRGFKKKLAEVAAKERRSVTNYLEVTLTDLWAEESSRGRRRVK